MNVQKITSEMLAEKNSWSPSMYQGETVLTKSYKVLNEFLDQDNPYNKGYEPGSKAYLSKGYNSKYRFVRTKGITEEFYHIYLKGESILSLNPNYLGETTLQTGDVLLSKDSNIGQVAVVPDGDWSNTYFSGGIVKLNIVVNKEYLLGYMKTKGFIKQIEGNTPKGATIRHAGTRWLKAKIPFPNQKEESKIIESISTLVKLVSHAELCIISKSEKIKTLVDYELKNNQKSDKQISSGIDFQKVKDSGRFDAAFHSIKCRSLLYLADNYIHGSTTFDAIGFNVIPGPTLEIKIIKKRIDSNTYLPGYYNLFLPRNISEYGTMIRKPFLGTPAELPYLEYGDVLVGEAGFKKGRSTIYTGKEKFATTNAHGLIIRRNKHDIEESCYVRSILDWYRSTGLFDLIAVGGSGGHLSPSYFPLLKLPKFKKSFKRKLHKLYYFEPDKFPKYTVKDEWTNSMFNLHESMGIFDLHKINQVRKDLLEDVFEKLSLGNNIDLNKLRKEIV